MSISESIFNKYKRLPFDLKKEYYLKNQLLIERLKKEGKDASLAKNIQSTIREYESNRLNKAIKNWVVASYELAGLKEDAERVQNEN